MKIMMTTLVLLAALTVGAADETAAIQARIDRAAAAGGGEVRIAPGNHAVGGLLLKSGVTLHLERDARLVASRNPGDYEGVVRDDGARSPEAGMYRARRWENAIIRMYGAKDVAIVGEPGSTIDGGNCADPQGEEGYRGPHGVSAIYCTNVTLRGYTLVDTGNWAHRILRTEGISAEGITVRGGHDGFHVRHSSRIRVKDCFFDTGDDAIAGFGNLDMVVSGCTLHSACSPVRLGGTDVLITDCTADGGSYPHRWTLSAARRLNGESAAPGEGRRNMGCFFQYFTNDKDVFRWKPDNMVFRNIVVKNADLFACSLTGLGLIWNKGPGIANIRFENVSVENCRAPGVFAMPPECPLKIVTKDCSFSFRSPGTRGFDVWNATFENTGLKTANLEGPFAVTAASRETVPVPSTFPSWTDNDHVARRMLGLEKALQLGSLFQDHAVVQRDKRVAVWGRGAKPFARVEAALGKVKGVTRAAADGSFMFRLAPQPAGGPYALEVVDETGASAGASDVYVGEVWLASGQSNMEFRMRTCVPGADPGDHPLIRQFTVGIEGAFRPVAEARGKWMVATEKAIPDFGGASYFFAQELQKQLPGVAVGIVLSSLGGTSVVSWSSRSCLLENPVGAALVEKYERDASDAHVWDTTPQPVVDLGPDEVLAKGWAKVGFDDSDWKSVTLPNWANDKAVFGRRFNGAVWFRRKVTIPKRWAGRELLLKGGRVDKHDRTYFGGELVGASGFGFDEHFFNVIRRYRLAASAVKAGETVVAIRAWSHQLGLGLHGKPEDLCLAPVDDPNDVLPLAGEWKAAIERDLGHVVFGGTALPGNTGAPYALYDAAIAPLVPYTLRGFLWYQGGNDVHRAERYRMLQTAMVRDWRRAWGDGDLPFVITLQAGIRARSGQCAANCKLAEMREAQTGTADDLPNVGVVSTVDIGCVDDGHPKDKYNVGKRMCAWAMKTAYGAKGIAGESPRIRDCSVEGKVVRIRFHHVGAGLRTKAGTASEVGCCAVQDKAGKWHDAKGVIDGETLLVSSPEVAEPVHARYAWNTFPDESANLENVEGLPCLPFRTDAAK